MPKDRHPKDAAPQDARPKGAKPKDVVPKDAVPKDVVPKDVAPKAAEPNEATRKPKTRHQVFTLLVEVGRRGGDGLPDGCTGAALMCYASGIDEAEAVRETVAILKQADLAPLDVSGYGTLEERLAEGHDIDETECALMERALAENSVIVAQMTPFYDPPEAGHGLPDDS